MQCSLDPYFGNIVQFWRPINANLYHTIIIFCSVYLLQECQVGHVASEYLTFCQHVKIVLGTGETMKYDLGSQVGVTD